MRYIFTTNLVIWWWSVMLFHWWWWTQNNCTLLTCMLGFYLLVFAVGSKTLCWKQKSKWDFGGVNTENNTMTNKQTNTVIYRSFELYWNKIGWIDPHCVRSKTKKEQQKQWYLPQTLTKLMVIVAHMHLLYENSNWRLWGIDLRSAVMASLKL